LGGGGAYLVMPLLRGRSWRVELEGGGAISPSRAADWFDQLCHAVAAAHASGVIHRDLKPGNVIVARGEKGPERITVLDFGLAKIGAEGPGPDPYRTTVGVVLGTLGYMSPEQRSGRDSDARADIYALGLMAVETLLGRRPPAGGTTREWLRAALNRDGIEAGNGDQEHLLELLARCLAEDPNARFRTISDFHCELVA